MPSIGELFVELGVVGNTRELEKTLKTMKAATTEMERQERAAKRLKQYLENLKLAKTKEEKADIKKAFEIDVRKDNEFKLQQKVALGKEFQKTIGGWAKGLGMVAAAVTAAGVALNKFTNDLVKTNQEMLNLTRTTDISQKTFQKWGGVGKLLGVDNAEQQLASLNEKLFELRLTGEGARGFQLAGINPMGQDAQGVLEQLRSRLKGLDDTSATYLLKQMGLDPQMLHLLRMEREEFEKLNNVIKKYQLDKDQTKQIQELNIQIQIAATKLQYFKDRAVLALMPAWTRFMASLARVTEGLALFVRWLKKGETPAARFTKVILGLATAVGVLIAALWALTAHPVVAGITAILGALYLLVDDVIAYFKGGRSGIGYIIGFFDELDAKINSIDSPKWLKDLLALLSNIDRLDKLVDTVNKIKNGESVEGSTIKALWNLRPAAVPLAAMNPAFAPLSGIAAGSMMWDSAKTIWDSTKTLPSIISPQAAQNVQNNQSTKTVSNDNRISMGGIVIHTSDTMTAFSIQQQLNHAQFAQSAFT